MCFNAILFRRYDLSDNPSHAMRFRGMTIWRCPYGLHTLRCPYGLLHLSGRGPYQPQRRPSVDIRTLPIKNSGSAPDLSAICLEHKVTRLEVQSFGQKCLPTPHRIATTKIFTGILPASSPHYRHVTGIKNAINHDNAVMLMEIHD